MTEALLKNHHVFADDLSAQTMAISRLHKQTEEVVKVGFNRVSNDIIKEIRIERGNTIFGIAPPEVGNNRSSTTSRHGDLLEEKCLCEDFVLDSLHFRSMHNRHEDIAEVHRDTFKWMIEQESRNGEKTSELHGNDFVDWLRRGDGIYWITGKAGSGKSTLMKHLYENSQTRQHLQSWAQSGILLIAGHFFWNSGTSEQRSQRGLFRSLLFEIFRAQRHLIPTVLPELWQELKPFAEKARKWLRPISELPLAPYQGWGLPRLHQIFKALTKIPKISTKICFFIDGLDEYEGEGSHLELVDNLKSLTSSSNVKICVSSRPWLVFEDAFSDLPGVRLEDLTFYDISSFVADKLGSHPRMKKLCRDEPEEAPKLTGEIVAKAHGVFLWVELVVRSLLNGLGNRDRISDLQRRLRLLPEELEDLYRAMLLRIDPVYRLQASQIFQLVQADQGEDNDTGFNNSVERTPLTVLRLAFADIEDAISIAVESPIALLTADEITSICEWMDQKLKSRCAGLLGTSKSKTIRDWTDNTRCEVLKYSIDSRVAYLHRTARDFLSRPETQSLLLSWNSDAEFDCSTKLLAACVLELKCMTLGSHTMWSSILCAMTFAQRAELCTGLAQPELLDELDHAATESWKQFRFGEKTAHWSHYIPLSFDNSCAPKRDTFLLYAAQHGLSLFLAAKKSRDPECFTPSVSLALNDYQAIFEEALGQIRNDFLRESLFKLLKL